MDMVKEVKKQFIKDFKELLGRYGFKPTIDSWEDCSLHIDINVDMNSDSKVVFTVTASRAH